MRPRAPSRENDMANLTKEQIDEVFEKAEHQRDYTIGLYEKAIPDFDNVVEVGGYPHVSKDTGLYITRQAIVFDQKHHPTVMNGGLWLNQGFSTREYVPDWTVDLNDCNIRRKGITDDSE